MKAPEPEKVETYFDSENLDVQNIVDELHEDLSQATSHASTRYVPVTKSIRPLRVR